jgi:xylulokinase
MPYVIGCDIGSQAVKAVLLSAEGKIAGEATCGYPISYPQPAWAEQSPAAWIDGLHQSIHSLLSATGVDPGEIKAIGLDAQVDGMLAIDAAGEPLYPAIIWMDRRATAQSEAVAAQGSLDRLFQISGLNLDPSHVAPKIRWFAEQYPDRFEKTWKILLPGSYVALYLSGELGVDYSNASSTYLMDVRTRQWSAELCDRFQVPEELLAPIYPANQPLGRLRPAIAGELGLDPQTLVVLGCGDEHAACLGAGVIRPGVVCDIAGTAEPVCAADDKPVFDPSGLVETHCHAHPDLWLPENPGFVSGANYRWVRDQFFQPPEGAAGPLSYEDLNRMAEQVPPGSEGVILLPCLMGAMTPTWNASARGTFFGFTLAHGKQHFVRATMEASAYGLRDITDRFQAMGVAPQEIRAVGGGARSPLWRQIKADVTGLPVVALSTVETTALGAALLALDGAKLVNSLEEAVDSCVQVVEKRQPDPQNVARYEDYYQLYREIYFSLEPVFAKAAEIAA